MVFVDEHAVWDNNGHLLIPGGQGLCLVHLCSPSAGMVQTQGAQSIFLDKDNWCILLRNFVADMPYNKLIIVKIQPCDTYLPLAKQSCLHNGKTL